MKIKRNIFLIITIILAALFAYTMVAVAGTTFTFRGKGTAHGVGLDMNGVQALAQMGTGYRQILSTYYTGVTIAGGRQGEWLKVGILNSSDVQITVDDGAYHVYPNNTGAGVAVSRNVVTHVTYESGKYVTRIEGVGTWTQSGFTRFEPRGGHLKILNNNRRFRGKILVWRSAASGLLWAINDINIEDYVKGVAEEPNTWPTEGQRTLAVAARTYALNKKLYSTRWDSENFDVDATLGSQYYLGFDAERQNLVKAANHTIGQVIMYGGRVIVAAYHGNSGGHTESIENVWGGRASDYPYLRGVPSPWGKIYRWGPITFTKSRLQDIFNSHAESYIGTLYSIDLSNRTPSGRLRKVRLTGSAGTKEIWGYSQFAAWLGLPSAFLDNNISKDNWDEYILLANPGSKTAKVNLTFIFSDRRPRKITRRVRPNSRKTISVDHVLKKGPSSVKIRANRPIVAERSMYFALGNSGGGHNTMGIRRLARRWYFAEGQTGKNTDTWLIIQNPRSTPTAVTATFMPGNRRRIKKKVLLNGYSRKSIRVKNIGGLKAKATPVVVRSRAPVAVERVTYFKYKKRIGGHGGMGSNSLSKTWYFAEGFTGTGFKDRLLVFNPLKRSTQVTVTLSKSNGEQVSRVYNIKARRRKSIFLNGILSGVEFGITVIAEKGVMAERTVYFNSGGKSGAHSTVGSKRGYKKWYFAEGFTGAGFDEFLMLLNLTNRPANVTIKYLAEKGGVTVTRHHTVKPGSRKTLAVGNTGEVGPGRAFAMKIISTEPVVAERAMYFTALRQDDLGIWTGGHVSRGVRKPSKRWFFAEGFSQ